MKKFNLLLLGCGVISLLGGCAQWQKQFDADQYDAISNPASLYCVQQNGQLEAFDTNGQRQIYCVLSETEQYEQWEYYQRATENNSENGLQ